MPVIFILLLLAFLPSVSRGGNYIPKPFPGRPSPDALERYGGGKPLIPFADRNGRTVFTAQYPRFTAALVARDELAQKLRTADIPFEEPLAFPSGKKSPYTMELFLEKGAYIRKCELPGFMTFNKRERQLLSAGMLEILDMTGYNGISILHVEFIPGGKSIAPLNIYSYSKTSARLRALPLRAASAAALYPELKAALYDIPSILIQHARPVHINEFSADAAVMVYISGKELDITGPFKAQEKDHALELCLDVAEKQPSDSKIIMCGAAPTENGFEAWLFQFTPGEQK